MHDIAVVVLIVWATCSPIAAIVHWCVELSVSKDTGKPVNGARIAKAAFLSHIYLMHYTFNYFDKHED